MNGTIDNGRRARVEFGTYVGVAGIVERNGVTRVAFMADIRTLGAPQTGTIDGAPYAVLSAAPSEHAPKRMVVLTVAPATAE